ncbi:MAG TPA: hypothetical protein VFI23_01550 [Rhizomicrobium sp.]|nr:hypothetical protein [Rhizomicrobium sp.]
MSHPNRFIDKCIHVRGFVAFRDVVPSLQWLYEHPKLDERVALYGRNPPGVELWAMRNYADLVGFAYSCEQLGTFAEAQTEQKNEEAKKKGSDVESIPFIAGNCHYRGGPVLWVSLITVDENSPNRLFGPAAAKFSSLTPMLPSTAHATEIANAIGPIFEFMRKQDKAGLEAHLEKIGDGGASSHANDAVDTNQNPFSFLLGAPKAPDVHYFVPKERIRGAAGNYASIGCVCKIDDCDGKWPIAELDASNKPQWPYSCIRAAKEDNILFVYLY